MARLKTSRERVLTPAFQPPTMAEPTPCWALAGQDLVLPISRFATGQSRLVENLAIREGAYEVRPGTSTVGDAAGGRLVGVAEIIRQDNTSYIVRAGESGIQVWQGIAWNQAIGATFNMTYANAFSFTGWGEDMVLSGGLGLYRLEGSEPALLTEITGTFVPSDEIIHLTTFAGRIIVSARSGIYWSARFDSDDFTGQGSGFEDLRSAPGGKPDYQTAVIPITDEIAFVIRSSSVWQMTQTGDPDAPFRFSLLTATVGSRWSSAVVAVRGGVVFTDHEQVWLFTPGGPQEIGHPVRSAIPTSNNYLRFMTAVFDPRYNEYRLAIPTDTSDVAQRVLRCNLDGFRWTEDVYPFPIRSMSFSQFYKGVTIDELEGPIDELVGSINDLGVGDRNPTILYVMGDGARLIARDDRERDNEDLRDVDTAASLTESGFRIETGDINVGGSLRYADGYELQLEYEAESDCVVTLEFSTNGGQSWVYLHQLTLEATARPRIIAIHFAASREALQYAISATAATKVRLIDLIAITSSGAMRADAN